MSDSIDAEHAKRVPVGPPVQSFPVADLEKHINTDARGKKRKPPVKLEECKLMELVQYKCDVVDGEVLCRPILRLFRQ